jgi:hypothetical protein
MVRPNPAIPNTVEREKMKKKMMGQVGRFWNVITMGAAFVIMMLAVPGVLRAQNATITGTVTDASHGPAAGVNVTARNTATNVARSAQSSETGAYRIVELVPGNYEVVIEKNGFRTLKFSNVVLTVSQSFTLDASLEVSSVTATVEVNAESLASIDLDSAQISNVVESRRITDLPLLVRDPYQLVLLSPGVIQSNSTGGGFAVNGQRDRNNNFLLDGIDNNDASVPGIPGGLTSLNPDSTQEFRVITNNFAPEYGRNTGAIIDAITKSGTNQLHGNAYWFGRYSALGARDFFNHNIDSVTGKVAKKAPYVRNDFGASLGGPLRKDKTFWFGNYEGQRFVTSLINKSTVPTAAFHTGIFTITQLTTGNPGDNFQVDVSTASKPQNMTGLPLDPTIQKILALYPAPNGALVNDVSGDYRFPSASRQTTDNFTVKIDQNFSPKEVLSARYTFNRFIDPNAFHTDFLPGLDAIATYQRTQSLSLGLTSTVGADFVNELRGGGNRTNLQFNCGGLSTFDSFGGRDSQGLGRDLSLSGLNTFGCGSLGDSNGQARFTGTYVGADNMTWVRSRHVFRWGVEYHDVYENSFDNFFQRAALTFTPFSGNGAQAANIDGAGGIGSQTLQDMIWTLVGGVDTQTQTQFFDKTGKRASKDLRGFRQKELRLFGQDTWKMTPNFTFTYGLAWQFNGVPYEVNNNLSALFQDPSSTGPFTFSVVGPGTGLQLYKDTRSNFEPRVGIAWDPFKKGKTSLRAGYGIFHDRTFGNLFGNARSNPPFQQGQNNFPFPFAPLSGLSPLPDAVPSATVPHGTGLLFGPVLFDRNFRNPENQTWNLGIQHQLFQSVTVEVNYIGSHGLYLFRQVDGNAPQPNLVAQLVAFCVPGNAFGCTAATLQRSNLRLGFERGLLPFDATNNNDLGAVFLQKSIASSTYHGLQTTVSKRLTQGLQIQGAYTYSHAIDNASDPLNPATGGAAFPRNSFNLRAERGNSDFDIRHRLVINYLYEIPLGRGTKRLGSGFLGRVLESWQVAGITTFQGGQPFQIFSTRDNQHAGRNDLAQLVGNPKQPAGVDKTFTGPAVSAFDRTPFNQASNLSRNHFYGPGENTWDVVAEKRTTITERFKLDFKTEVYNIFNRVNFGQPDTSAISGPGLSLSTQFGKSTSQLGRPDGTSGARQVQFALKLQF